MPLSIEIMHDSWECTSNVIINDDICSKEYWSRQRITILLMQNNINNFLQILILNVSLIHCIYTNVDWMDNNNNNNNTQILAIMQVGGVKARLSTSSKLKHVYNWLNMYPLGQTCIPAIEQLCIHSIKYVCVNQTYLHLSHTSPLNQTCIHSIRHVSNRSNVYPPHPFIMYPNFGTIHLVSRRQPLTKRRVW